MTDNPTAALYHPDEVRCFGDAHPVLAVRPDGTAWPWLLGDHDDAPQGCCCPACAPHEQTGPLPNAVRVRLAQCEATSSTTGRRCRNPARPPGRHCHVHDGGG